MMNLIKTHGPGISTAILSLAMLGGMSACQSEQSSPAASDALPQAQAQKLNPREQMIHRRAVEAAVWGMPMVGTRGFLVGTGHHSQLTMSFCSPSPPSLLSDPRDSKS